MCPRHNASEIPRCVVQHVPVPFVDTPLTSNVREAVERDWSTKLNGPAVRLYGGEESAAYRVGYVGRRLGAARAPWACCARGVPRSPWPWRWQLIGTSRWCPVDGEIPPNGSASTRRTRPAGRPRQRGRTRAPYVGAGPGPSSSSVALRIGDGKNATGVVGEIWGNTPLIPRGTAAKVLVGSIGAGSSTDRASDYR